MAKNIIFPINNKGGVGKTSVLTDLVAILSQRYNLGILDMDTQGSLAGTLLGDPNFVLQNSTEYDEEARDVELMPRARFTIKDPLKEARFKVEASSAKVGRFPVGVLYHDPKKISELDHLVNGSMGRPDFIAVDLPPVPDAALILDHSIKPLVDVLGGDVNLFPVVVTTPDHNVIKIGLKGFRDLTGYLEGLGFSEANIKPIHILNKLPMRKDGKSYYCDDRSNNLWRNLWHKMEDAGIGNALSEYGSTGRPRSFKKRFDMAGYRFLSVFLPLMPEIKDGRFSLFYGMEPSIMLFPYLAAVASKNGFPSSETASLEAYYLFAINHILNNIVEIANKGSKVKAKRNFSYVVEEYDRRQLLEGTALELAGLADVYYETGKFPPKPLQFVENTSDMRDKSEVSLLIPRSITIEQMAGVLNETGKALGLRVSDAKDIEQLLSEGAAYSLEIGTISDFLRVVSVSYRTRSPMQIEVTFAGMGHPHLKTEEAISAQSDRVYEFFDKLRGALREEAMR